MSYINRKFHPRRDTKETFETLMKISHQRWLLNGVVSSMPYSPHSAAKSKLMFDAAKNRHFSLIFQTFSHFFHFRR
jgi:hypothetical protein